MKGSRLVADVGGTRVRFARADGFGRLSEIRRYATADHRSFETALERYLSETGATSMIAAVAIAAAGPVEDDIVRLTNLDWSIDARAVAVRLSGVPVELVNDLEAVASALPHLSGGDLRQLGPVAPSTTAKRARIAINVGTGFGAAAVVPVHGRWITCPGEPGHMTLAAISDRERAAWSAEASVEDVLSGRGLSELYRRLCAGAGDESSVDREPAEILRLAASSPHAAEAVELFTGALGRVAGDLVLATGAWGGAYLCGSVLAGWAEVADVSAFRALFETKGRMRGRMEGVPVAMILHPDVALAGLARRPPVPS